MIALEFQCRHRYASGFTLDAAFRLEHRVTSLFGPSGSGKTSVLSMIGGFVAPQSGRIHLPASGKTLVDTERRACLPPENRGVGIVFQDHLLFPHLSVEANLRYGEPRGARRRAAGLERVVDVLELGTLLKRYPSNLSGGEKQRVAIGRALMSGPELLLLDEPLAALDHALKSKIIEYLERVVSEWQMPALFVSHSQADVRRLADWVIVLERGRVLAQETPEVAFGRPELLRGAEFPGPANLLRIEEVREAGGALLGRVGDQWVSLPTGQERRLPFYVQFSPRDVILSLGDVQGVSARNHLSGIVRQIVPTPSGMFVAVEVGPMIWAEVTAAAATELQLAASRPITCLIKTSRLEVVG